MDVWSGVVTGFQAVFQLQPLMFCFLGVLLGTLVGVLPGLGPLAAVALLLPITYQLSSVSAIIMLSGIYYGAAYGGSTTSILLNIPGESSSVVTCLDGYQMARNGKAGPALGIAAFGSFIAGTLAVVGLMFIAPPLAELALKFGPPEYFSLVALGVVILSFLSSSALWKTMLMAALGFFLGCIGTDGITGDVRFSFGRLEFSDGLNLVPYIMGLFGISEVLLNVERTISTSVFQTALKNLLPNLKEWSLSILPILRGTILGFFLGCLPGGGAILSSFMSYAIEKKISKYPEKFGTGVIEGVAGPEAANNSGSVGAFIPLLSLGIPCNGTMAVLLGALIIHGIQPGPMLLQENPDVFWGLVVSMYFGNVLLLVLNLPLIGIWVKILKVPYPMLFPLILLFCIIGSYSINNSILDIYLMAIFGILGYLLKKFNFELAPMVLAFVLGPIMEFSLRQALLMSGGDLSTFFVRPISAVLLAVSFLLIIISFVPAFKKRKVNLGEDPS